MATLYRQYRPQTFAELVGQDQVRDTLKQAVLRDKLTHAYLFHGPRGTGKTTTARLLAKRVNCLTPKKAEPCGACDSCVALQRGKHIDVLEIDAASNRGIDDVRALREATAFMPSLGTYKVYIIDEVHMLTNEAASALLKTLEEPVAHVLFILATTELHKVLPTIISRSQVYRFRRAQLDELVQRLAFLLKKEERVAEPKALTFIADRADGCYRDAESLLGQMLTLSDTTVTRQRIVEFLGLPPHQLLERFLQALVDGQSSPAIVAVDEVFASGIDPEQFLRESIRSARDEALRQAQGEALTWATEGELLAARAPHIIRALLQALQDLAYVPQPMIALHLAILTLCATKGEGPRPPAEPPTTAHVVSRKTKQQSAPAPRPTTSQPVAVIALETVAGIWKQLIEAVRHTNPVAGTFLRAVEPAAVAGNTVTIRAQFALHCTFFEKPNNRKLVAEALSTLVDQPVTVSFVLAERDTTAAPSLAQRRRTREDTFQRTVQEVFGTA